jgi:hypothetical protein
VAPSHRGNLFLNPDIETPNRLVPQGSNAESYPLDNVGERRALWQFNTRRTSSQANICQTMGCTGSSEIFLSLKNAIFKSMFCNEERLDFSNAFDTIEEVKSWQRCSNLLQ